MARDESELVACEDCGCLNERATLLLNQAREDIANLERELRTKRAKITKLEADRRDKLRRSPRYEEAMEVLRLWQKSCAPNAKEIDSQDRLEAVLARMNGGHTADELKLCATGYSKRPYVTREGRAANGAPAERKVDAALIFGTPKHVANGIAYASTTTSELSTPMSLGSIERLGWRRVKEANRRFIVRALEEYQGAPLFKDEDGYAYAKCPKCESTEGYTHETLRIAPPGLNWLATCWQCGLDDTRLIAAITEDPK